MVHYLVKFFQQRDIFICDYLAEIKVCHGQLYTLYMTSNLHLEKWPIS